MLIPSKMRGRGAFWFLLLNLLVTACGARPTPAPTPEPFFTLDAPTPTVRPPDTPLFVLGHFTGESEAALQQVLARFEEETGVIIEYQGEPEVAEGLRQFVTEGRTPDVLLLPRPNWLRELAAADAIPPLDEEVAREVAANFGPAWVDLVSYEGQLFGVPLDANAKSLLWYRPSQLEALGLEPPQTLDDLFSLGATTSQQGRPLFAVPGEPRWPLTDWFESVLLATAGPQTYDALAAHSIAWTDPVVQQAAEQFVSLLRDEWLMGGAEGAAKMPLRGETFAEAFDPNNPGATMWQGQGVSMRSLINESAFDEQDFDFVPFPAEGGIVGAGSVAVATNASEEAMALLRFLSEPETIELWIGEEGFISPNHEVSLDSYPTRLARQEAELVREATLFRYDLSDLLPPNLRDSLYTSLREMILHPDDVPLILEQIEQVAHREQGTATGQ